MALPPAHSWGWLRFMLNEHPVLKHTRDGIQRLPEAAERLPLVWASSCAPHWPPALRPRAAVMLWRENKQLWGSTGSPLGAKASPPCLPSPCLALWDAEEILLYSVPAWPGSHPSFFPVPRQLLLRKVFLGTAQNIPALFRLKSIEVGPGSSPVAACPLQAVMQFSRSPGRLSEFISTLWHTLTHRMCLASEAADAGFIPSLVASDWHKCRELLVENCLWALGLIQTPLKTKERLVIALELALDQSHYLCPKSSVQTKQQGLGHCEPVPRGPISSGEEGRREMHLSLP